jgi:hypothetical protein
MGYKFLIFLLAAGSELFPLGASAQTSIGNIMLPTVEPAKNSNCKIFSRWTPSKNFLNNNPDFLKDGSYKLSTSLIKRGRKGKHNLKFISLFDYTEVSSSDYPAVWVSSEKKINTGGNVYVEVLGRDRFPLAKGTKAHNNKNIGYIDNYSNVVRNPNLKNAYNNLNNYYKEKAKEISARKFISPAYIANLGNAPDSIKSRASDIFFDFEFTGAQSVNDHFLAPDIVYYSSVLFFFFSYLPWNIALTATRKNSSAVYPSNLLMELHVKDFEGKDIKTYSQAVFVNERHLVTRLLVWNKNRTSTKGLILRQALPAAMESLISQAAEDSATINGILEKNKKRDDAISSNPGLVNYVHLKEYLVTIKDSIWSIAQSLAEVNRKIAALEHQNNPVDLNGANIPGNASLGGALIFIAAMAAVQGITNGINNSVVIRQINYLQTLQSDLNVKLRDCNKREDDVTDEIDDMESKSEVIDYIK